MKCLWLTLILVGAPVAYGYEFKLHFTPPGGAQGLVVAGYEFSSNTVVGNCSYYTVSSGSGRGSHGTRTNHYNTCSWDLFGNLISLTPVSTAPVAPKRFLRRGQRSSTQSAARAAQGTTPGALVSSTHRLRTIRGKR